MSWFQSFAFKFNLYRYNEALRKRDCSRVAGANEVGGLYTELLNSVFS
jgi:hypothetical protein